MTNTCPYCRTPFEPEDEVATCPACGTSHHRDCAAENGGCTVFGCSEAPVEEPKISVTTHEAARPPVGPGYVALATDLAPAQNAASTPPPPGRRAAVPPPPRPAGWVPPPPRPGEITIRTGIVRTEPTLGFAGYAGTESFSSAPSIYATRKSRVAYVLLAIFFGIFGVHNFYAGYIKKAVIQVCITLMTCFYGAILVWIWAVAEACMISKDEDGVAFN